MAPAGRHGVLNDATAIYFNDATLAGSYVARWRRLQSPRAPTVPPDTGGRAGAAHAAQPQSDTLTVVAARGACTRVRGGEERRLPPSTRQRGRRTAGGMCDNVRARGGGSKT